MKKTAFDLWIEDERGKQLLQSMSIIKEPYNKNIIWHAFNAGQNGYYLFAQMHYMQKEINNLKVELNNAKKMITKLTKLKRKNK